MTDSRKNAIRILVSLLALLPLIAAVVVDLGVNLDVVSYLLPTFMAADIAALAIVNRN